MAAKLCVRTRASLKSGVAGCARSFSQRKIMAFASYSLVYANVFPRHFQWPKANLFYDFGVCIYFDVMFV